MYQERENSRYLPGCCNTRQKKNTQNKKRRHKPSRVRCVRQTCTAHRETARAAQKNRYGYSRRSCRHCGKCDSCKTNRRAHRVTSRACGVPRILRKSIITNNAKFVKRQKKGKHHDINNSMPCSSSSKLRAFRHPVARQITQKHYEVQLFCSNALILIL